MLGYGSCVAFVAEARTMLVHWNIDIHMYTFSLGEQNEELRKIVCGNVNFAGIHNCVQGKFFVVDGSIVFFVGYIVVITGMILNWKDDLQTL
jgi:hypothetical protein